VSLNQIFFPFFLIIVEIQILQNTWVSQAGLSNDKQRTALDVTPALRFGDPIPI